MEIHAETVRNKDFEWLADPQAEEIIKFELDCFGKTEGMLVVYLEVAMDLKNLETEEPITWFTGRKTMRYIKQAIQGHPAVVPGISVLLLERAILDQQAQAAVDGVVEEYKRKNPTISDSKGTSQEAINYWPGKYKGLVH